MGCVTSFFAVHAGSRLWRWFGFTAALVAIPALLSAQSQQPDAGLVIQMLREHRYSQAVTSADQLLSQHPHDCRLLSLRGIALNSMQRPAEAERSFQNALQFCPDDLVALEGAAEIAYALHQPQAPLLLQRILALRPQDVTTHAMLASFYRGREDCRAAMPHFEASQALFASRPKFREAYAFCLAKTEQYEQAAAAYRAVLEQDPDPAARYNLALVQWRMHDPKSALDTLRPLLSGDANEMVLALGSRVAEDAGDTPLSVNLLRSAILLQPKDMANYLEFAQISFNHQSFQVGIDVLNAGLTQLPDAASLYLARGVLEMQLSQSEKAIADFEQAHKLEPQLSLAMDAMGIVESQQYNQTAALDLFGRQARLHPRDSLLQYLYAEALSNSATETDAARKAIQAAEKSVSIEPGYAPARDLLALLWLRVDQPQKALEQAQAAMKIQPDDDVALYHEIMARRRLGQTEQVEALVKQLAEMRSQNAQKEKAAHRYTLQEEPGS
ncbi:MAG TPA: tetratricopeptide repeat protein [Acidobacteriaceae bacterium]|nr:tetratricopeptide repeat protein [Acidobacteriaceae bacterium]